MHIVDELILERVPTVSKTPLWPLMRPMLNLLLGYKKAVTMVDQIAPLGGQAALDRVSEILHLDLTTYGLDRIPPQGRCVVVCNHPTGIADGIAVADAIKKVRQDAIFFANADAIRVNKRFEDILIPVEWVESKRTREKTRATLMAAKQAFEDERCVVLFPAGRLARREANGVLNDPPWMTTAISMAHKNNAVLVPMHLKGPNAFWFHFFNRFSVELRDITLFHEFLNKAGKPFYLTVAKPVQPDVLQGDVTYLTSRLKNFVEKQLEQHPDMDFEL